jgi:hypothetical protein
MAVQLVLWMVAQKAGLKVAPREFLLVDQTAVLMAG